MDGMTLLTIFVLSIFVGFEVVSKVSVILHTPLMSGANAIHGVILVGAIIVSGRADTTAELVLGLVAVVLATVNMVGGFVVTDRMLEMFKPRKAPVEKEPQA
ncbi:MAG: NAD(P) transhydrogenase subunit alpha [Actinomycetota bacterium]|nr:NAD(P) transhydrogenase subunit alpha [Actinomycetota bacterium]MDH4352911.1 NAD(P) transhydrogenase subunit alpha [Actinomycetota bacterium]